MPGVPYFDDDDPTLPPWLRATTPPFLDPEDAQAAAMINPRPVSPTLNTPPTTPTGQMPIAQPKPSPIPPVETSNAPQMPAPPVPPKPGIGQRLAAAAAGFAGGYTNAAGRIRQPIDVQGLQNKILYPGQQRAQAQYESQRQQQMDQAAMAKEQATTEETKQRGAYYGDLAGARRDVASTQAHQRQMAALLKGREEDAIYQKEGDPIPPGYETIQDVGNPGFVYVVPPSFIRMPEGMNLPGRKPGDIIPYSEFKKAQAAAEKAKKNPISVAPGHSLVDPETYKPVFTAPNAEKPPSASENKDKFQTALAKVSAELPGGLPANAMSDVGRLSNAIRTSKILTADEKNGALAYLAANTTPAAQGTAATIRVEGYGDVRVQPVLDTKNGNQPTYLSVNDITRANQQEPGRYIPAAQSERALNRTALIEDIHGSVQQTRDSLQKIPEFSPTDKIKIATALRDRDPRSAVSQLIGSAAGSSLTPDQQEYLINLAQLHEQALAMRSVLGAGQGSEDLRAAIMRTIPGPSTPNKAYASKQLDAFEATLNRLSRGIPKVPLRSDTGPTQPGGVRQQGQAASPAPGAYKMTATGPNGHKIGSNDGNSWFDVQTGQAIK